MSDRLLSFVPFGLKSRLQYRLKSANLDRVCGWLSRSDGGKLLHEDIRVVHDGVTIGLDQDDTIADDGLEGEIWFSFKVPVVSDLSTFGIRLYLAGRRDALLQFIPPGRATDPAVLSMDGTSRRGRVALKPLRDPFRTFLVARTQTVKRVINSLKRSHPTELRRVRQLAEAERIVLHKLKLVDPEYYQAKLGQELNDPVGHFLDYGRFVGIDPNEFFSIEQYFNRYQDVLGFGMDPLLHYEQFGWKEGRDLVPRFDGAWYLKEHRDVAGSRMSPLHHYMAWGRQEGRAIRKPAGWVASAFGPGTAAKRILIACHDCEIGGAQRIAQLFAEWLLAHTRYDVAFVAVRGGAQRGKFAGIAPTFVIADYDEEDRAGQIANFLGDGVSAVFVNSIAAGSILRHLDHRLPVVGYIHELRILLDQYPEEVELVRERAANVIGGSDAVVRALVDVGFDAARLSRCYSFVEDLTEHSSDARATAREALGLSADDFVVMACGVIHWRKSPEVFIEVARYVAAQGVDAKFVWLGGGPDREECEQAVADAGLTDAVRFTGYEPDVPGKFAAGDVFCLPSREDPFPLVGLYAAQVEMPVVCFRQAGGMPEFTDRGAGSAVAYLDAAEMAEAIIAYAKDPALRKAHGACGRSIVLEHHTLATAGPRLLSAVRKAAGVKPEVSVIVPNYNYERYLPERIATIEAQSFQDFEVILLDDASTDGSLPILEAFAARRADATLITNDDNSGSPFVQWIRGMAAAQSDLVWIAEADDEADPELLGSLIPLFDDRAVRLASVASVPINTHGAILGDYRTIYLDRIAPGRFDDNYKATDHEEASAGLGIANTIPNASAVVMRRYEPDATFAEAVTSMRLCGDWFMYLRSMRSGLYAFVAEPLNRHRRHDETVTHKLEGSTRYFDELAAVRAYVGKTYRQSEGARETIARFVEEDIARFGLGADAAAQVRASLADRGEKAVPTLLVVAPDLSPGGGQMFAIRLANAWADRGGRALILNANRFPVHPKVIGTVSTEVAVLDGKGKWTLDAAITRFDVDIVHSTIWWADRLVEEAANALPSTVPWVTTMHGCAETLLETPKVDSTFAERFQRMKKRVDAWVYTADKNRTVFDRLGTPDKTLKIDNGVPFEPGTPLKRANLGVRDDTLLFLLATRAIREKGWDEAVWLIGELNARGIAADLMLIGEGDVAERLRREGPDHVRLYGYADNLNDFIATADIGLLPSTFSGESLPLVILEMMAVGLPVIATDRGEIPSMVGTGQDAGGIVVPLKDGTVDREGLLAAALSLASAETRAAVGACGRKRYEARYTMDVMMDRYAALYDDLIAARA